MTVENDSQIDSKVFQIAAVVIAAVIAIGIVVYVYNKEKVGKSSNPAEQRTALTLLASIPIKLPSSRSGYSREQFGKLWDDNVDVGMHNGCETRLDILRRGLSNVTPSTGCPVDSGVLHDPYTGRDIPFNRDDGTDVPMQIDHVVPLLNAWQTGAQELYKRSERGSRTNAAEVETYPYLRLCGLRCIDRY